MTSRLPNDFGDWISPILVKELRQGLRTRVFTIAFIALQTVLLLFTLAGMRDSADPDFIGGSFWFLLVLVLVVITPVRGLNALSSEVKQNTLDLLSLTRLNAFRICFGKWAALFTQALLFTVAVLPYVVLRYFSGGIDLFFDFTMLGFTLACSAVLCAVSLTLSALASAVTRSVFVIGLVFLVPSLGAPVLFRYSVGPGGGWFSPYSALAWLTVVLVSVYLTYFCLSAAATRIAPPAENYSTLRRLIGLAAIGAALLGEFLWNDSFLPLAYFFALLLSVDALTERPASLASVHAWFLRLGFAGRPLQLLLSPGWHSGALLACVLLAVHAAATNALDPSPDGGLRMATIHLSAGGVLLLPLLISELVWKDPRDRITPYLFIQAGQLALGGFVLMLSEGAGAKPLLWLGSPLPSASLFAALSKTSAEAIGLLPISAISFLVILSALLMTGRRHFTSMFALRPGKPGREPGVIPEPAS